VEGYQSDVAVTQHVFCRQKELLLSGNIFRGISRFGVRRGH